MSKNSVLIFILILSVIFSLVGCGGSSGSPSPPPEHVTITNSGTHYEVVLNYDNISHYDLGVEYGQKLLKTVPDCAQLLDSYIAEISKNDTEYQTLMDRTDQVKPQVDQEYRDEINGMASNFNDSTANIRGDGKLSLNELYFINLITDVARTNQCSALAVFGARSATTKTMAARILDWYEGKDKQLAKLQAVITYKNGNKSICAIGYLGFMGVLSGFNDNKVFAAILDSPSGAAYSAAGKRSYPMDLRYALENSTSMDEVANYMKSATRSYAYSHLIFLADPDSSKVLENNISTGYREVRTDSSTLRAGISWGFPNAVGCVNSFVLNGDSSNNHTNKANTARWESLKEQLNAKGPTITLKGLEEIISFDRGDGPGNQEDGDLYNSRTQQIIIFEPNTLNLQLFFRPVSGLPSDPTFESVAVSF